MVINCLTGSVSMILAQDCRPQRIINGFPEICEQTYLAVWYWLHIFDWKGGALFGCIYV